MVQRGGNLRKITSGVILALVMISTLTLAFNIQPAKAEVGLAKSPWPMFGHDPRHTSQSPYVGAQTEKVKWSRKIASSNWGAPSPTIDAEGIIYIGSDDSYLYAFYPNGSLKWRYKTGDVILSSVAIDSTGTLYFGSRDHYLYALYRDGVLKWKYLTDGPISSSPAIGNDGTIYIGSEDGYLYAINSAGNLKWKCKTDYRIWGSSPAIGNDGTIYIGTYTETYGGYLYAITPDGVIKWKIDMGSYVATSATIDQDGTIYINVGYLYAITPDGVIKWSQKTDTQSSVAISNDGTIYTGQSLGVAAFKRDGSLKWSSQIGSIAFNSLALGSDGTIYVASWAPPWMPSPGGYFNALNIDGTFKWRYKIPVGELEGNSPNPAIGDDGTVYVLLGDGTLYAFGPGPIEKPRFPVDNPLNGRYWIHVPGSKGHFPSGGFRGADDTYALDLNWGPRPDSDLGKPVYAIERGVIKQLDRIWGWILIEHRTPLHWRGRTYSTWYSGYLHMQNIPENLKEGVIVEKSTKIGEVGRKPESRVSSPHLHFAIYVGRVVEPSEPGFRRDRQNAFLESVDPGQVAGPEYTKYTYGDLETTYEWGRGAIYNHNVDEFIMQDSRHWFERGGSDSDWFETTRYGFYGHMFYTHTSLSRPRPRSFPDNWGRWNHVIPLDGKYKIYVFLPRNYATTMMAKYQVFCNGILIKETIVSQQIKFDEWVWLGDFSFKAGDRVQIFLSDCTGENGKWIAYDTVKFLMKQDIKLPRD